MVGKKTRGRKETGKKETREKACELAAIVLSGVARNGDVLQPVGWSLAVFFEQYMLHGAKKTRRDFGPKAPVNLTDVKGRP